MGKRRGLLLALFGALLLSLSAGVALAQAGDTATAQLADTNGNTVGNAEFVERPEGVVVTVNLQPGQDVVGPGEHGIHIHEKGDTTPDFEAAGEHFNPDNTKHGLQNPQGPHAGDLENMVVNDDGSANYQTITDRVTLSRGTSSILDSDGSTLVIHRGSDDQQTDPSGSSGGRAIAGVIRLSQTGEPTTPAGGSTMPSAKEKLPKSGGLGDGPNVLLLAALMMAVGVVAGVLVRRRTGRA